MNPFNSILREQRGKIASSFRLGRVMGIPLYIHLSWFVIFALVIVSLSLEVFRTQYPQWPTALYWIVGLVTTLLFFASVVFHELCHSWFSLRQGIPVKSITLFIFGGVARISRESPKPMQELSMAAAGPVSSLIIGGISALAWWQLGPYSEPVKAVSGWLTYINLSLAGFNLIPGFPLDGGRVLRSIMWKASGSYKRATRWASWVGQGVAYAFVAAGAFGLFVPFQIGSVVIGGLGGVWLVLIGWFLQSAASSSYAQSMLREALRGLTVRDVVTKDCVTLPKNITLKDVAQQHIAPSGRSCFLASDGDELSGIITLRDIKAVPQARWDTTTLGQAMTPIDKLRIARLDEGAVDVLDRMDEEEINQMPVMEAGKVVGIVTREGLYRFIRTRTELGI